MIRHIVMYRFQAEAEGRTKEENLKVAADLASKFLRNIPELKAFSCVIGSKAQAMGNYDIALICDIDSFDALASYKENPTHKAFGTHCHAVSDARAAIDFEI